MVAALLLVELGCAPQDAINRVRAARPGALSYFAQEEYVRRQVRVAPPPEVFQLDLLETSGGTSEGYEWRGAQMVAGAVPARSGQLR
jgi:hypothetical protein